MRENSMNTDNNLHWHDGTTCHGHPTLDDCTAQAIACQWVGRVLEHVDTYPDGSEVRCYSLVASSFDTHGKRGRYVAEVKVVAVIIPIKEN